MLSGDAVLSGKTGADLGFYKGGCPIYLKGAPEVERRRSNIFPAFYIFIARCYASALLAMGLCPYACLSVCLSVSVSVTSRCSTKTAKRRITKTTPHDTPGTLVF